MNQLMNTSLNPEYIITQLLRLVNSDKRSEIRLNANGGNSVLVVCPPSLEYQFIEKIWNWINKKFDIFKNTELLNRTTLHVSEIRTDRSDIQFKIEESKSGEYDVEFSIENIDPETNISTYRKETFYQVLPVDEMLAQFGKYYQQNGDRIVGILQRPTIVINI